MKNKLFLLFVFIANIVFAQISKGEISYEIRDSFSYEYEWERSKKRGYEVENYFDTIVVLDKNYVERIWVVGKNNYKQSFLNFYHTFSEKFNQKYSISSNDYWDFITDLDKNITSAYQKTDIDKHQFVKTEKPRKKGVITDLKIDKQDTIIIEGYSGYKIEYIEKFNGEDDKKVKMYVTQAIQFPIQFLINYPEDLRHCPLYIEYYKVSEPKNKTIYKLISVKNTNYDAEIEHFINK